MNKNITTPVVYGAIAGAILGNVIPTPGDALNFHMSRKLRDDWTKGLITSKQYWARQAFYYYTFNASWWAIVLVIVANIKGDAETKIKVAAGLAGVGAVLGVILKNIRKDEEENLSARNYLATALLEKHLNSTGAFNNEKKEEKDGDK